MVDMHHIISDGVSHVILTNEFRQLYAGIGKALPPLRLQYKDYSQWQNSREQKDLIKEQEAYWLAMFSDEIPVLNLPTDFPRPVMQSFAGCTVEFLLTAGESQTIKSLAKEAGATLFMSILAIFSILLAKLSDQEDIIVGTPVGGRRHTDLEPLVGMFVNTLAVRNQPLGTLRFNTFLKEVKKQTLEAYENQEYPFEELVDKAAVNRDTGRNPLFDVMFNLANQEEYTGDIQGYPDPDSYEYKHRISPAKFDLTLTTVDLGEGLFCAFEYCTKLFAPATIERFITYFKRILDSLAEEPDPLISQLVILTETEKHWLLYEFNDTKAEYPREMTIHELFEKQVEKTPDNTAVVYKKNRLTYRELNLKSRQLAYLLAEKGIKPDTIAGISMERSPEMIIGILGILKAGGAYLPIDPEYPEERVDFMLKDSNARILLKKSEIRNPKFETNPNEANPYDQNKIAGVMILDFEHLNFEFVSDFEIGASDLNPSNLSYIIYTSGTTGKPKGVMIDHRSLVNYTWWAAQEYVKNERVDFPLYTSISFDLTVTSLFTPLVTGNAVIIFGREEADEAASLIGNVIRDNKVGVVKLTPAHLRLIKEEQTSPLVKRFILGGEELETQLARDIYDNCRGNIEIFNEYGPTEATVGCMIYRFVPGKDRDWDQRRSVSIGRPAANARIYILDGHRQPVPPGVTGELYISGDGIARGYLNRPELTADKFDNEKLLRGVQGGGFLEKSPPGRRRQKIYKTGDLARLLSDGNIEFLGRIDHQVKVRGYRIELGEIENRFKEIADIKEAVVIAREDSTGDKSLHAYVTAGAARDLDIPALKNHLVGVLPAYMVPASIVQLAGIPLTTSGKVDRKALPAPFTGRADDYAPPVTGVQKELVRLWSMVLGIREENISIDANFFEWGGNSLKAAQLTANIHRTFQVQLSLGEIFQNPTIRGEALTISKTGKTIFFDIETVEQKEFYQLSYHQRRLWIISRLEPDSAAYNMPERIELTHKVDENTFKKVIDNILERHESLRTGFKMIDKKPVQFVVAPHRAGIPFKFLDLSAGEENQGQEHLEQIFAREAKTPFDLTQPPLLRFLLVKMAEEKFYLVFNMHHIITDGFSQEILKDEFMYLYEKYRKGEPAELAPLAFQYKDFAAWQDKQLQNPRVKEQSHRFWKKVLEKHLPPVALPVDSHLDSDSRAGAAYQCVIPGEIKDRLNQLAQSKNTSLFIVMLALFNVFLSRVSGQEEIRLGLPVSGRDHISLQNIVGFFVNTVILDTEVNNDINFIQFLEKVHGSVLEVLQHQAYPLEVVLDDLNMKFPGVNVFFNMLNLDPGTLEKELDSMESYHTEEVIDVKFDFMVYISEYKNGILLSCNYKKAMFGPSTISANLERYLKVIDFFTANPGKRITEFKHAVGRSKKHSLKRN